MKIYLTNCVQMIFLIATHNFYINIIYNLKKMYKSNNSFYLQQFQKSYCIFFYGLSNENVEWKWVRVFNYK